MTRKDYELLAGTFAATRRSALPDEQDTIIWMAKEMAGALKLDNPRFDVERFMKAVMA